MKHRSTGSLFAPSFKRLMTSGIATGDQLQMGAGDKASGSRWSFGSSRFVCAVLTLWLGLPGGFAPVGRCGSGCAAGGGWIGLLDSNPAFAGDAARFVTLPPGATLPSGAECAARVPRSPWEARSENTAANRRTPMPGELERLHSTARHGGAPAWFFARVDGDFTGTTDEIIRWGACKWGFDEDLVRAIAMDESHWLQSDVGDWTTDTGRCPAGSISGGGCFQSYGLLQIKYSSFPGTWPMSRDDTAFNVDYKLAYQRACMEGKIEWLRHDFPQPGFPTYPNGSAAQMLWGCVGDWYSGEWYDSKALGYIQRVREELGKRGWEEYPSGR